MPQATGASKCPRWELACTVTSRSPQAWGGVSSLQIYSNRPYNVEFHLQTCGLRRQWRSSRGGAALRHRSTSSRSGRAVPSAHSQTALISRTPHVQWTRSWLQWVLTPGKSVPATGRHRRRPHISSYVRFVPRNQSAQGGAVIKAHRLSRGGACICLARLASDRIIRTCQPGARCEATPGFSTTCRRAAQSSRTPRWCPAAGAPGR